MFQKESYRKNTKTTYNNQLIIKLRMKNYNILLTEKQQIYHHYHLEKLINMNFLQARKYYLLIKGE